MVHLVLQIIIFLMLALLLGTLLGFLLSRSMVRDVRTNVEQLNLDVAASRKQLSAAETDLQLHKSALSELRAAYDGLHERLSVHSDRQADLSGQMEGLVAARSALSERTATLASQLTEAQAGLGRQLEAAQHILIGRIEGLSTDRDEHAHRLLALEAGTDALTTDMKAIANRHDLRTTTANDEPGPTLSVVDALSDRISGVEARVADVAKHTARAADQVRVVADQHEATARQLADLRHKQGVSEPERGHDDRRESLVELSEQVSRLDEHQHDLEARVSSLEVLPGQVQTTRSQFERLQSTAAALTSRLEHQDRWGQEAEDRLGALENRLGGASAMPSDRPQTPSVSTTAARPSLSETPSSTGALAANVDDTTAPDDLKRIRGVGVALERSLHAAGIRRFEQIASWRPKDIQRVAGMLEKKFKNRITRDDWVSQAKALLIKDGRASDDDPPTTVRADSGATV